MQLYKRYMHKREMYIYTNTMNIQENNERIFRAIKAIVSCMQTESAKYEQIIDRYSPL